jgi:indolepyruvate ferredoxin oxidoreductase alpha subunit
VLCPSFYRADIVHTPGRIEQWIAQMRARVIQYMQERRRSRWLTLEQDVAAS